MPQVILSPAALRDLKRLREFLHSKSPVVAQRAAQTIRSALAAVFAAKALLYWAADWLALGPLYSALAGPSWNVAAWIAALALLLRWMKV